MPKLTQEYLKSILHYNPKTGVFTWLVSKSFGTKINSIAGTPHSHGYIQITIDGLAYYAHRLAWFYVTGKWPDDEIDHKDLNKKNNKWENLRPSDDSGNGANRFKYSNNKSGYKGVYWAKIYGRWHASVQVKNKRINLGYYDNILEAAKAYEVGSKKYFKNFARS